MRLELTGRQITITPSVRALVEGRVGRVLRLLNDHAVSAQVVLTRQRLGVHAEATLHARGEHFLHAEASAADALVALGLAIGKVDRQARTLKGKWQEKKRSGRRERSAVVPGPAAARARHSDRPEVRVIRARRSRVRSMTVDDAALSVAGAPGAFLVFRNVKTDEINVAFRRPDGHVGWIEIEA